VRKWNYFRSYKCSGIPKCYGNDHCTRYRSGGFRDTDYRFGDGRLRGLIKRYIPKPGLVEICKKVVLDVYEADFATKGDSRKEVLNQNEELSKKQKHARELLLKGDLDGVEYREIKLDCETKTTRLEAKLSDFSTNNISIERDLNKAVKALTSLCGVYNLENMKQNRKLIGSIYPEKFTFENLRDRTARINETASVMYQIYNVL